MEFEIKCLMYREYNCPKINIRGIFRQHNVDENGLYGINNIKVQKVKFDVFEKIFETLDILLKMKKIDSKKIWKVASETDSLRLLYYLDSRKIFGREKWYREGLSLAFMSFAHSKNGCGDLMQIGIKECRKDVIDYALNLQKMRGKVYVGDIIKEHNDIMTVEIRQYLRELKKNHWNFAPIAGWRPYYPLK